MLAVHMSVRKAALRNVAALVILRVVKAGTARSVQSHPQRNALPQGALRVGGPALVGVFSGKASLKVYTVFLQ